MIFTPQLNFSVAPWKPPDFYPAAEFQLRGIVVKRGSGRVGRMAGGRPEHHLHDNSKNNYPNHFIFGIQVCCHKISDKFDYEHHTSLIMRVVT